MSEKTGYQWMRKIFRSPHRVDRIENLLVAGMPDVNVKVVQGIECWVEIKSPTEPKRSSTALIGGSNHPVSQDQKNWFLRQRKAGGHAMFFIVTDKRRMLVPGIYADQLNEMTVNEILEVANWSALIGAELNPQEFLRCFKK